MDMALPGQRWRPALAWIVGTVAYAVALGSAPAAGDLVINNVAWTLAPLFAAIACFRTARRVTDRTRRAWFAFGYACVSWLVGQLYWEYNQLALAVDLPPFPSLGQLCYVAYAILMFRGLTWLRESDAKSGFTPQHLGNLGLIACCFAVTVVIAMIEPVRASRETPLAVVLASLHCSMVLAIHFTALYCLWSYRWRVAWLPLVLVVAGTGIQSIGNLIYIYQLITHTYVPGNLVDTSWILMFAAFASAAAERRRLAHGGTSTAIERIIERERWLEAVIPALLIIVMVGVAIATSANLTPHVMTIVGGLAIAFAVTLGAREAWIQGEAQRLTSELTHANDLLLTANAELTDSERRYRDLNRELERRVGERTAELQAAYEQMEGFAYAVAHDLKTPLRAIDGFGQILAEELGANPPGNALTQLARIRRSTVRMSVLIDDLLAYSRVERRGFKPTPVSLATLVNDVMSEVVDDVERKRVSFHVDVPPVTVLVDAEGLTLVLRNLLQNALKFSRNIAAPRIDIAAQLLDRSVRLVVRDNGIGFDMQYHELIFKLFHRLHREEQYPGTGIGLALVRKAIERMNGRVWAESADGAGAVFHVELPVVAVSESASEHAPQRTQKHENEHRDPSIAIS
jgi:signal transduction histidine kinase